MIRLKRIYAMVVARNLEFFRDRASFFWQLLFPIIIVIVLGFTFGNRDELKLTVGVLNLAYAQKVHPSIVSQDLLQYVNIDDLAQGMKQVEQHRLDILIDPQSNQYWINEESNKAPLLETLLFHTSPSQNPINNFKKATLSGRPLRYIDWMIPGMLAMNLMFNALWGVGFVIVRYRKNEVLKRLKATPTKPIEFLIAQLASRLLIIIFNLFVIFLGLNLIFKFRMYGSFLDLCIVMGLGSIALLSIGLIIAAQIRNEEVASGLVNLVSWPMMMLSEIWFPLDGAHVVLQRISSALPLTQVTHMARAIMLDGASIVDMPFQSSYLIIFSVVCLAIGAACFKWE